MRPTSGQRKPQRGQSQERSHVGAGAEPQGGPAGPVALPTQLALGHGASDPAVRALVAGTTHRRKTAGASVQTSPAPPGLGVSATPPGSPMVGAPGDSPAELAPISTAVLSANYAESFISVGASSELERDTKKHGRAIPVDAGAAGTATSLDTKGTSHQGGATVQESGNGLLDAMAELTAAHRHDRARWCFERARAASSPAARRYWRQRAFGQLRRWQKVADCGERWAVRTECRGCGHDAQRAPLGCGVVRACPKCRTRLQGQRRARARQAIEAVERQYLPQLRRARDP